MSAPGAVASAPDRKGPAPVTEAEVDAMLELSRSISPWDVPSRAHVRARLELLRLETWERENGDVA